MVNMKGKYLLFYKKIYKKVAKYSNKPYYNNQLYVYLNQHIESNQSIKIIFKLKDNSFDIKIVIKIKSFHCDKGEAKIEIIYRFCNI